MSHQPVAALVFGGTGAVGRELIKELIASSSFSKITSIVRRKTDTPPASEKYEQVVITDMDHLEEEIASKVTTPHDVAFCTFGTTKDAAGSANAFRKIDFGYSAAFGKAAKENGVKRMYVVTGHGSDPNSFFLYLKVKGEVETYMNNLAFPNGVVFFRPGLLDRGQLARTSEKVAKIFFGSIHVAHVAKSMCVQCERDVSSQTAKEEASSLRILNDKDMLAIVKSASKSATTSTSEHN